MKKFDYVVIGGGVVGLSTAYHILQKFPASSVLIIEKESGPAFHQTGRNSGVIHSGIYYKPGSFKAKFAKAGAESMAAFCEKYGIGYENCGKVIVATKKTELPLLESLYQRGIQNEIPVEKMSPEQVSEIEPHVACVGAVQVKTTGIVSYVAVCNMLVKLIETAGGVLKFKTLVIGIEDRGYTRIVKTQVCDVEAGIVINCAGLFSDRLARMAGEKFSGRIIPFRGEYFELLPEKRYLVKTLIYPVPNPKFPFLGVHFTRMIDGSVHAGPNAVLALKREGYLKTDFDLRDFWDTISYPGFWKLVSKNFGEGLSEMHRSLFKSAFVHSLQQLVPEVRAEYLVPCKAGVRAQSLFDDGKLVEDFVIIKGKNILNVCNAPSPAATASLEIGKYIVQQLC
jgi:L-2-hydroxyglutarate oxidase